MLQKHVNLMVLLFALCWLPLNVLNIVTHLVYDEASEHSAHFAVTSISLTCLGFLSTCMNPLLALSLACSRRSSQASRLHAYISVQLPYSRHGSRGRHGSRRHGHRSSSSVATCGATCSLESLASRRVRNTYTMSLTHDSAPNTGSVTSKQQHIEMYT